MAFFNESGCCGKTKVNNSGQLVSSAVRANNFPRFFLLHHIVFIWTTVSCLERNKKKTMFFLMNVSSASAHLLHKSVNVYMYIDLLLSCFSLIKPKSATILLFHKPLISWLIQQLTLGNWQRSYILYLCFLRRWAIEEIIYIKYFFWSGKSIDDEYQMKRGGIKNNDYYFFFPLWGAFLYTRTFACWLLVSSLKNK